MFLSVFIWCNSTISGIYFPHLLYANDPHGAVKVSCIYPLRYGKIKTRFCWMSVTFLAADTFSTLPLLYPRVDDIHTAVTIRRRRFVSKRSDRGLNALPRHANVVIQKSLSFELYDTRDKIHVTFLRFKKLKCKKTH